MANYHAEKKVFLDLKVATKVKTYLKRMGFIEATSNSSKRLDSDTYRIVIYHPDLQQPINDIVKDKKDWTLKDR